MAGHVPKFGAQNAGNFTEVFALAREGGKAGSGDSEEQQQQQQRAPQRKPGGRGGAPAAEPRRSSGSGSGSGSGGSGSFEKEAREPPRGSNRSSQERPSPPTRERERGGRGGGQDSSRGGRKPRNVNDDNAGASHLPKFGDWNNGEAGDANYTVMFTAASKERQTGSAGDLGSRSAGKSNPDLYNKSLPKKQSSSWWCFS